MLHCYSNLLGFFRVIIVFEDHTGGIDVILILCHVARVKSSSHALILGTAINEC